MDQLPLSGFGFKTNRKIRGHLRRLSTTSCLQEGQPPCTLNLSLNHNGAGKTQNFAWTRNEARCTDIARIQETCCAP